jgi:hypothetical protein
MPLVSFSHYREKCFFVCPTLPNYASIFFINIEGRQKKNAILDNVKKKGFHMNSGPKVLGRPLSRLLIASAIAATFPAYANDAAEIEKLKADLLATREKNGRRERGGDKCIDYYSFIMHSFRCLHESTNIQLINGRTAVKTGTDG